MSYQFGQASKQGAKVILVYWDPANKLYGPVLHRVLYPQAHTLMDSKKLYRHATTGRHVHCIGGYLRASLRHH